MVRLKKITQGLLCAIFGGGGIYRLIQPIEVLQEKMLWVAFFDPLLVRLIALTEVVCALGLFIPLVLKKRGIDYSFQAGLLLTFVMLGAAITHLIIGDYDQISANLALIGLLLFVSLPRKKKDQDLDSRG